MNTTVNIQNLSKEERAKLLAELQNEENQTRIARRETYEALRAEFMHNVDERLQQVVTDVRCFHDWLQGEVEGFVSIMKDYGQVRNSEQRSYTVTDGDFRLEIASNKVKGFDERADLAAERLIDYLKRYMKKSEKGSDDPMYQMAMTLLERNKAGDLDYKSISKLYDLEAKFDGEYSEIMNLFKEANVVQKNAVNYYFSKKNPKTNVWERIEPSFCRL
jgi:translation initiation factor IF-2